MKNKMQELYLKKLRIEDDLRSMLSETSRLLKKYSDDLQLKEIENYVIESHKHLLTITSDKISNSYNLYEVELNRINDWLSNKAKKYLKDNFASDEILNYDFTLNEV